MTKAQAEYPVAIADAPDSMQNSTASRKMATLSLILATARLARNKGLPWSDGTCDPGVCLDLIPIKSAIRSWPNIKIAKKPRAEMVVEYDCANSIEDT